MSAIETETVLDTRVAPVIRVENAALDEAADSASPLIMRGRIATGSLRFLKTDRDYQRDLRERPDIWDALQHGKVLPDIDIGVRGQDIRFEGGDALIASPAYIIDGWQRVGNALRYLDAVPDAPLRLGALVHFGTTPAWEAARFTDLNKNVKRVSGNLHLRNLRSDNAAILTLYGLSNSDRDFPLRDRVSWDQDMHRGAVLSASTLVNVAVYLHARHAAISDQSVGGMAMSVDAAARAVSLNVFRRNVMTFFEVVDECWGLRSIVYRHGAPHIKGTFLRTLARVFDVHPIFWNGSLLALDAPTRRKLAGFAVNDPQVAHLAGAGSTAGRLLYELIISHINSGRRERRLVSRFEVAP